MTPFPWKQAMGFGLGILRLSPEQFWRTTPRELASAIEALTGHGPPIDRSTLTDMMRRFPDEPGDAKRSGR